MKFIHISDLHASKERLDKALSVLEQIRDKACGVDFVAFAGDFFDSLITNTESSGFTAILGVVGEIAKATRVYMVYGTASHEPKGCLDVFKFLGCEVFKEKAFVEQDCYDIVLLPEPRKSDYNSDEEAVESYAKFMSEVAGKEKRRPRVCVFHGEVKGAVYQNGMAAASSASLPRDLFEKMNCDYYAFGHIHKPQKVFENAFYAGSAIPLNFGETHDGHYNLVEIKDGETKVSEVSLDMPRYKTMTYEEYLAMPMKRLIGKWHVRMRMFGKECEYKEVYQKFKNNQLPRIQAQTGAISVKFLYEVVEENEARSETIREMSSLKDKLTEYAKVMELAVPKKAGDILEDIEVSELVKTPSPSHTFELVSVRIKGSKGIKDGCGKEEIFVNFEDYREGLTAVVGENGRGKTTFLENCSPYPFLLTRGGPLRDHFYLNPSARETVWKDETGRYHKLSMIFYCAAKQGSKSTYMAYTSKDGKNWQAAIGVDGSLTSFVRYVNSLFGSVDLYMRTAFQVKERSDRVPDITEATKGERIELFSALAGIGQMRDVCVAARERAKVAEQGLKETRLSIKALQEASDTELLSSKIVKAKKNLKTAEKFLAEAESRYEKLSELDLKYKSASKERELKEKLSNDLKRRMAKNGIETGKKEAELGKIEAYFKTFAKVRIYRESVKKAEEARDTCAKAMGALNDKYTKNNDLISEINEKEKPLNETEKNIGMLNAKIAMLEDSKIELGDRCPLCGAALDEHKKSEIIIHNFEAKRGVDALKTNLKAEKSKKTKLEKEILSLKDRQLKLAEEIAGEEEKVKRLQEKKKLAEMKMKSLEKFKPERDYTEGERVELVNALKDLEKEKKEIDKELGSIEMPEELEDVSEDLADAKEDLAEAKSTATDCKADLKALESMKKNAEDISKKIKGLEKKAKEGEAVSQACRFLETAFGQKGIPALELENTAPEISMVANSILSEVFNGRFTLEIAPLRQGLEKQIVDFTIIVKDSESKWEKSLDLISSGEKVWIKQALYGAFSIVLSRQTGLSYKVRFIDEADGTLFSEQRGKFIKLVKKISSLSGADKTVVITQSQEVKDCIDQRIEF